MQSHLCIAMRRANDAGTETGDFLARRFPRLLNAMKGAAILCNSEATAALRDYVFARDGVLCRDLIRYGGGEAVCHFGGPLAVIQAARRYASMSLAMARRDTEWRAIDAWNSTPNAPHLQWDARHTAPNRHARRSAKYQ